jgi:dihydrofolate reductase
MISIIVAMAKNNVIGKKNELPWYIPEDLKHFKKLTDGKIVLMGSKTFESIINRLGEPLPNRTSIVISSRADYIVPPGVLLYTDLNQALDDFRDKDLFIIGGASIYKQTIDKSDKLYVTEVDKEIDGDAFFPEIDLNKWKEVTREPHEGFSFVQYRKA